MAFDVIDPTHLSLLKSEVATDPIGMGYSENTSQILKQLNDPDNNIGGETIGDDLTVSLLMDAIMANPGDLTIGGQFTQGELDAIKMIVEASNSLRDNIEQYRVQITSMFQASTGLRQALEAQSRVLSRAEVLFDPGTNITRDDWITARES